MDPGGRRDPAFTVKIGIVTVSDRSFRGEREDLSGPALKTLVRKDLDVTEVVCRVVPDDENRIVEILVFLADIEECSLILTTGGTGFTPRDITPEATAKVIERQVPGLAEAMRAQSLAKTPMAMLSRAVCGLRGKTLIVNLPGSPRGASECFQVIGPVLPHALKLLSGEIQDCGQSHHDR